MPDSTLKHQLNELQKTLAEHPQLDAESLIALQNIAAELDEMGINATPELTDLVQEQVVNFEQDYPTLAAVLQKIVSTLASMGI
ncbi:MAG: DUF4404 family protein [Venatoribacter sp.]